jgi:manganese transport protein
MKLQWNRALKSSSSGEKTSSIEVQVLSRSSLRNSLWQFLRWVGPALMVSIAYMDPGNYGTDLQAGAGYRYDLLWVVWLASAMAMLLQYLSGKLGIVSGYDLPQLVRKSFGGRKRYVIPYWLASEAAPLLLI